MNLKLCYKNILESSTVTLYVAGGGENALFPLYRLHDRNIGWMFQPSIAATMGVKIDQGETSPLAIDRLLIPAGHNLAGMTLDIFYSDNNTDYYPAVTGWTGVAGLIDKSWASMTHRYWQFYITSPGSIPQIPELFLSPTYTFEKNPSRPTGPADPVFNVKRIVTSGGQVRHCVYGSPKRRRIYPITRAGETQKDNILLFNDIWAGSKPFWLCDHNGVWIFGELLSLLDLSDSGAQRYPFKFDFLEVLPE